MDDENPYAVSRSVTESRWADVGGGVLRVVLTLVLGALGGVGVLTSLGGVALLSVSIGTGLLCIIGGGLVAWGTIVLIRRLY